MSEKIVDVLRERLHRMHELLIKTTEESSEEQLAWIPTSTAPPIRWHIWHTARFADLWRCELHEFSDSVPSLLIQQQQIWRIENLTARWALGASQLGGLETGVGMADHVAATLSLPEKSILLDYCQRAFQEFERAVGEQPIAKFDEVIEGVGAEVTHAARHLGMIEALKGAQKMRGTATI